MPWSGWAGSIGRPREKAFARSASERVSSRRESTIFESVDVSWIRDKRIDCDDSLLEVNCIREVNEVLKFIIVKTHIIVILQHVGFPQNTSYL